jgi:hypothetical protein
MQGEQLTWCVYHRSQASSDRSGYKVVDNFPGLRLRMQQSIRVGMDKEC